MTKEDIKCSCEAGRGIKAVHFPITFFLISINSLTRDSE
jgi:hypothetical protein